MIDFSLSLPTETQFGWNRLDMLPELATRFGGRAVLVRGGKHFVASGLQARISELLRDIEWVESAPQRREPEPEDVDAAAALARDFGAEMVIAIGGGSVLDLGKAAAALASQSGGHSVRAYLEGVGEGLILRESPLPYIAIPTTSGTGSEATRNAVISSRREGFKKSLRDQRMMPDVALIDPSLTLTLPEKITAWSGMDALTQLIESYTTRRANPVTDALALEGVAKARMLEEAYLNGEGCEARKAMSLAAYLSGVCLSNSGLGAVHGIAAALGGSAHIAHGLACALALPWVIAINAPVAAERYARLAEALTGEYHTNHQAGTRALIDHIWRLMRALCIPRAREIAALRDVLLDESLPELALRCHSNSLNGNPRTLSDDDLVMLFKAMRDAVHPTLLLPVRQ